MAAPKTPIEPLPEARTHELVAACEEKQIRAGEIGADKSKEPKLF